MMCCNESAIETRSGADRLGLQSTYVCITDLLSNKFAKILGLTAKTAQGLQ